MKKSVILLSGGMDSVTLLYDYRDKIALALSFYYGANHNKKELEWAKYHCEKLGVRHIVVSLDFMAKFFKGNLLQGAENVKDGMDADSKKDSVIPFRNGILLSIACGMAESNGLDNVLVANHKCKETTLPDCSIDFVRAMNTAMEKGTYNGISICAPYTEMFKEDIMRRGKMLGVDYKETYSCYKGGERHCGTCPACMERKQALKDACIIDTTIYEK